VAAPARHGLAIVVRSADLRGLRYPLVPVLAIAVCAMLAGARLQAATAECAADAPPRLRVRDPGHALPGHVEGNQPGLPVTASARCSGACRGSAGLYRRPCGSAAARTGATAPTTGPAPPR
jgi:hypothetical protein